MKRLDEELDRARAEMKKAMRGIRWSERVMFMSFGALIMLALLSTFGCACKTQKAVILSIDVWASGYKTWVQPVGSHEMWMLNGLYGSEGDTIHVVEERW
jgi:hypothetical protein